MIISLDLMLRGMIMATSKPISTICYCSEPFLLDILNDWIRLHLIQSYMYIKHKGEEGDKDHIHLRVEPNKTLDPMDLSLELREYVPGNDKPLTCRPWRPSKEEDWILYAVHDPEYLRLKYGNEYNHGKEKLPYKWEDIKCYEYFDMETAFIRAKQYLSNSQSNILKELQSGKSVLTLVAEGRDVNKTRAILQSLQLSEYEKLVAAYEDLKQHYDSLKTALIVAGIEVMENDEGEISVSF